MEWDLEFVVMGKPASLNEAYATVHSKSKRYDKRTGRTYWVNMTHRTKTVPAENFQDVIKMSALSARNQAHQVLRYDPCFVDMTFWYDRRGRDIDNPVKLVQDALSKIIYEDDRQIVDDAHHKRYDKDNPRTEIKIKWLPHDEIYGM